MKTATLAVAVLGTGFIVFVLPYVLAIFGMAPNGTEVLILMALLLVGCWAVGRRRKGAKVRQLAVPRRP